MTSIGSTSSLGTTSSTNTGTLSSPGIGSGLDVKSLVSSLVSAQRAPLQNQIDSQTNTVNTEITALGTVSSALSQLQTAMTNLADSTTYSQHSVASSDSTILGATGSDTAVNGSYSVNVTSLATAEKASSQGFASGSAVGTGTLTVSVGSNSMSLTLDSTNNTLQGIRDAINNASNNPGVSATIVSGSDGDHLVLTSTATGAANTFSVTSSGGDGGLAALNFDGSTQTGNLTKITAAADAQYSVDGINGTSASNTVTSAIDGVTLNLASAGSATVTVSQNQNSITNAVKAFVDAYNNFNSNYSTLTSYNQTTGASGPLIGDVTLNSIQSKLSGIVSATADGTGSSYNTLAAIGITLQKDGSLKLDSTQLQSAVSADPSQVQKLFSGTNGYSTQINGELDPMLGTTGLLANRTDSLNQQLSDLQTQQSNLDQRMSDVQARYLKQFNALDQLLTQLNSTSSFLTKEFASISGSSSSKG